MSARFSVSQRDSAYQPRAPLWVGNASDPRVLKERRISPNGGRVSDRPRCGVPSERMNCHPHIPRVAPRAGMQSPPWGEEMPQRGRAYQRRVKLWKRATPGFPSPEELRHESPILRVPTGQRIPAQSTALGRQRLRSPRSEGTPHIPEWRTCVRSTPMRRSFRTHELQPAHTQGCTLGWYAWPRWGRNRMPLWDMNH